MQQRSDVDRGKQSRQGFGEHDKPHPAQDSKNNPELTPPADQEVNPPTHPSRDDGLGKNDRAPDKPVPSGDPNTESDRTDLQ